MLMDIENTMYKDKSLHVHRNSTNQIFIRILHSLLHDPCE
jgi:hypothetical protein